MKLYITILIFLILITVAYCSYRKVKVQYIDILTSVSSDSINGSRRETRSDYFIIYNSGTQRDADKEIKEAIKPFADSFSRKFSNYIITLYLESGNADTNYIKSLGKGYYYKALLHEEPYMVLHWWGGRLLENKLNFQEQ
jgi:hypothetical protein